MPYVSSYDFHSNGETTLSVTTGSISDEPRLKTNKLSEGATLTLVDDGGGIYTGVIEVTAAVGSALSNGCLVFLGGIEQTNGNVKVESYTSGGALIESLKFYTYADDALGELANGTCIFSDSQPINKIKITFTHLQPEIKIGRIWLGNLYQCAFDAGWVVSRQSNTETNRTVGGSVDIVVKNSYRTIRISTSGEHMTSGGLSVFSNYNSPRHSDFCWDSIDLFATTKKEMVFCWRDVPAYLSPNAPPPFVAANAFSMYGFPKTSSGIKHLSGDNFKLDWTIEEHL